MSETRVNNLPFVILLIVSTILLTFIGTIITQINSAVGGVFMCRFSWGTASPHCVAITYLPFIVFLLAYPLRCLKGKITDTTIIFLYILSMTVSWYGIGHFSTIRHWPVGLSHSLLYTPPDLRDMIKDWWWIAPYDAVTKIRYGGVAPPWDAWTGVIIYTSLHFIIFYLLGSSIMLLFRRRWLDIEKVPFPYVITTYEAIRRVSGEPGLEKTMKWFIIGFLIGFLWELQILMTGLLPWWPDLLAWRGTTSSPGCVCLSPTDPIEQVLVWWPGYNKSIAWFFIAYLAPLEILFSTWAFFIVMIVLAQIAYVIGYYTGVFGMGSQCRILGWAGYKISPLFGPPYYFGWMSMVGGILAIVIMTLFHARSYLAETVKLAIRGGRSKASEEAKEPFSYRQIYTLMIVSAIMLLALCLSVGLSIETALIVVIFQGFIYTIASSYIMGLSGFTYVHERGLWPGWPFRFIWPVAPETYDANWIMSHVFMHLGLAGPTFGTQTGAYFTIQNLKMGDHLKVNLRDMFIMATIAVIIAVVVRSITIIWFDYLVGTNILPASGVCSITQMCDNSFERYNQAPPAGEIFSAGAVGFTITVILSLLRARFLWWPLHPIGFLLATGIATNWDRIWTAILAAWIVKYLTLRIGGTKLYEEFGTPFVSGGVAGVALLNLVAYLVGVVRFFRPF